MTEVNNRAKGVYGRLQAIWKFCMPVHCVLCAGPGYKGMEICHNCLDEMPLLTFQCSRCAAPLEEPSVAVCPSCQRQEPTYERVFSPFRYQAPVDWLIHQFKFGGRIQRVTVLSDLFLACLNPDRPEALIPVPMHRRRLRNRGFNQARELAWVFSQRGWGLLLENALVRCRDTRPQSELGARQRRRNLVGAFAVRPGSDLPRHVALVDDVMTTGSTIRACAETLSRAGVTRVDVWVVARA